tara:strand:+ start:486 stop:752 length:267 start_codon:yes stop_codon:yes gene_type:complete
MWKDIIKIDDKDRDMYLDAVALLEKINTASNLEDIKEFINKYKELLETNPVEWPTMHNYLLEVTNKYGEIKILTLATLKTLRTETKGE